MTHQDLQQIHIDARNEGYQEGQRHTLFVLAMLFAGSIVGGYVVTWIFPELR